MYKFAPRLEIILKLSRRCLEFVNLQEKKQWLEQCFSRFK